MRNMSNGKGLTAEQKARLQKLIDEKITAECFDSTGKRWSERRIASHLGITQPQLRELWLEGKGAGVRTLTLLRDTFEMSIDDLLELPPPSAVGVPRETRPEAAISIPLPLRAPAERRAALNMAVVQSPPKPPPKIRAKKKRRRRAPP